MKKYKLIKKYPSLNDDWEVGMEVYTNKSYYYKPLSEKYSEKSIKIEEIEKNPDFWEYMPSFKIIKLTLGDKIKGNIYNVLPDGHLLLDCPEYDGIEENPGAITVEDALNSGHKIYSVERMTDTEIFTVGDKSKTDYKKEGSVHEISSLVLRKKQGIDRKYYGQDLIWVNWSNNEGGNWIDEIQQCEPFFTTEDGVDMYDGDFYYVVYTTKNFSIGNNNATYENIVPKGSNSSPQKTFADLVKAQEYIDLNIPKYSLQDIKNCIVSDGKISHEVLIDMNKLKSKN